MSRRLIIYENDKLVNFSNDYMTTNDSIYNVYDGKIYNPPSFDILIVCNKKLSELEHLMCWNMINSNGKLVLSKNFKSFYEKFTNKIVEKDKLIEVYKTNSIPNKIIKYKYRLFDFGIIGVQKGGTTSLLSNLNRDNQISIENDENHFFDYNLGLLNLSQLKMKFDYSKLVGFKNPDLIYLENNFSKLQIFCPSIKLIIILRNPVNRAYSAWNMMYKNPKYNNYNKSFDDSISDELKYRQNENKSFFTSQYHFLQRGYYYKQLKELLKFFSRRNILIIISEKMFENPKKYYEMIYKFLGISLNLTNFTKDRIGTYSEKLGQEKYNYLMEFFKDDIKNLEELLNEKTGWI